MRPKTLLLVIVSLALVSRVYLVLQGGQFFWPDEAGSRAALDAVRHLAAREPRAAVYALMDPSGLLHKTVGIIPALIQYTVGADSRIPALFFSVFSVAGILATWRIAVLLSYTEYEALCAALLLACSSTWFYYSRHLLPYDLSMALGLVALVVAIRQPSSRADSLLCGLLSALTLLAYAGYWTLAAFVIVAHAVWRSSGLRAMATRLLLAAAGFAAPIGVILAIASLSRGSARARFINHIGVIDQGRFDEGWSLPLEYFWHAEHLIFVLWIGGVVYAARQALTGRHELRLPLAALLFIYGALVVTSVWLERFVVYGRLARQLVPFFCLVTAPLLYRALAYPRFLGARVAVLAAVIVQAAANMATPLRQVFPEEFRKHAHAASSTLGDRKREILFADHIYPKPKPVPTEPHRVVIRAAHPLQFVPYLYEGYQPEHRAIMRATDISMRLVVYDD